MRMASLTERHVFSQKVPGRGAVDVSLLEQGDMVTYL